GSPEALNLAKGWLRACNDNHTICQRRPPQDYFPTRVLDVGFAKDSNAIRLFIPQARSSSPFEPYITLSHQWGASEKTSPILKRNNLTHLCQSIDISTLPRVFRDAIALTKLFGIRYLWIDRLCIIQDSDEDWSHEAQLMQKVYASSYCSIAASDADDPSKGCFFDRCPEVVTPWKRMIKDGEDSDEDRKGDEYSSTSLYGRGWVLQESILAPRILHCSNRQLYWECPSNVCCETFPTGLLEQFWVMDDLFQMRRLLAAPAAGYARLHHGPKSPQTGGSSDHSEEETADAPMPLSHQTWLCTVEIYTRCQLTYPKDKLIAISGIAGVFHPSLGTYCLGLWKDHLSMGLLWSLAEPPSLMTTLRLATGPKRHNRPYRAPSWSWASVDG
ncbi:heterokaryon incompatibility protein-domain-containing protein, partial [Tricladium varicosporioides]